MSFVLVGLVRMLYVFGVVPPTRVACVCIHAVGGAQQCAERLRDNGGCSVLRDIYCPSDEDKEGARIKGCKKTEGSCPQALLRYSM